MKLDITNLNGFDHQNRGVGIRNLQLILPSVVCSTHISRRIANEVGAVTFAHQHGCAIIGDDVAGIGDYFESLAAHPNIGSVLIVGLGCETIQGNELAEKLVAKNSSTNYLIIQESGGVDGTYKNGVKAAEDLQGKYPPKPAKLTSLHIGIDLSSPNLLAAEVVTSLQSQNVKVTVSSSHKNSGLNFSELMESGVHLILSFPDANQPTSGFPFIPVINIASDSALHTAIATDFDLPNKSSVDQVIEKIQEVVAGAGTKVEKMGAGEIITPRVVRSV
jgi:altronate dehydratase large subunit